MQRRGFPVNVHAHTDTNKTHTRTKKNKNKQTNILCYTNLLCYTNTHTYLQAVKTDLIMTTVTNRGAHSKQTNSKNVRLTSFWDRKHHLRPHYVRTCQLVNFKTSKYKTPPNSVDETNTTGAILGTDIRHIYCPHEEIGGSY